MSALSLLLRPVRVPEPKGGRLVRKLGMQEKPGPKAAPVPVPAKQPAAQVKRERAARRRAVVAYRDSQCVRVIAAIRAQPGLTAKRLADVADVPLASIYQLVHRLRRYGSVQSKRERDDKGHSGLRWYPVVYPVKGVR